MVSVAGSIKISESVIALYISPLYCTWHKQTKPPKRLETECTRHKKDLETPRARSVVVFPTHFIFGDGHQHHRGRQKLNTAVATYTTSRHAESFEFESFYFCCSTNLLFRQGPGVAACSTHFIPDLQTLLCITSTLYGHSALLLSVREALVFLFL